MSSPELLKRLAAYVPTPVAQAISQQPYIPTEPIANRLPAAVLFIDISGFTPLSELLSQAGPTGAEELTHLINEYFTHIIETIEAYQGQVVKFSGDALTVLFPAENISLQVAVRRAGECALTIQAKMSNFTQLNTSQGPASLWTKIGIGAGEVLACHIGGILGRWEYLVAGDPLVQVATAEHRAEPRQIILSPQAWQEARSFFEGIVDAHGFVNLNQVRDPLPPLKPSPLRWDHLQAEQMQVAERALKCYIPGAIQARLHEQSEWLAELRRMTVLFVGIGGFDYEAADAKDELQKLLQVTQEIIYRLEGALDKVTVDDKGTIMVILFGVPPFTHEDDAQRAVTCALRLQPVAEAQNLRMSIGITEGSIFAGPVGAPSRQEYTVIGDQVNLATRFMQYGRHGDIIISEEVKKRTGTNFIVESLGNISVKGKINTLPAYCVRGEEGAQFQFVSRYFSEEDPLIGRKAELKQIRRLAARARDKQLQVLFIEGELGLGKSRLVSEMVREWIMGTNAAYGSKCNSYGRQTPYQGWQEILSAIYGLTPDLSPERRLARLASAVADLPDPPEQPGYWANRLPLLTEVLNLDIPENEFTRNVSGELRRNNTFALIEALLHHQAESQPLLIILEDIHWADELSILLAAHLAKTLVDTAIILALVYRPLSPVEMGALADIQKQPYARTIRLEPLTTEESLILINFMLGDHQLSEEAQAILLSRGQGNPFFLQEISRAILTVKKRQTDQSFRLSEPLDLPGTVQDAILARVDRLPDSERLTLKVASVIGATFERLLLSTVHPVVSPILEIASQLADLEREKLIHLEVPEPKWEYAFHNVITQEVVYEGLLLAQRRQLHTSIGATLEKLVPDAVERLAYHYRRSNNLGKGLMYLKQAAQKARREYANQTAINYYSEILVCLAASPANIIPVDGNGNGVSSPQGKSGLFTSEYWDILLERAKLYNLIGNRNEEAEDLGTLGILAEALNDNRRRALSAKQWARFYETKGDIASGLELIERSVELAHQTEDEKLIGEGYNHWGKLLYLSGDYNKASEYLQQALHIAQKYDDKVAQADCLHTQGIVSYYQTEYHAARAYFHQAVHLRQELEDQLGLSTGLRDLGRAVYKTGQYITAQDYYHDALAIHRIISDRTGEALTQHYLGIVQRNLGNYPVAKKLLEESLAEHQALRDRRREANNLTHLGFLYGRLGDYATALSMLEEALTIIRELNDPWALSSALTYYSWILTEMGEYADAQTHLQEALKVERDIKRGMAKATIMEDIALLGRIALARKDLTLAVTCAQHTLTFLEQHGTSGVEHPAMVYLITYQILSANQKTKQAKAALRQGQAYITTQAAQINDPTLRQCYLDNISENRELLALAAKL
jgi:class 3 adenylate cyclase/tetratricopeptide (TPR) repeat protein